MVCSTAILSSSLALSLLRHSAPSSDSFVLSPFSLNTALVIVHDGASGTTQQELTNFLLKGCAPSDVTAFYSSLGLSLPSTNETGVAFKSANRFYVDDSISLMSDYQKHVEDKYKVKVENTKLRKKEEAAQEMNKFVEGATNGKIKDAIKAEKILDDAKAILINAIYFLGKWSRPFTAERTNDRIFKGYKGDREIPFMNARSMRLRVNLNNDVGTVLLMPYKDKKYNFFYLMPNESSNLEKTMNELRGETLIELINGASESTYQITVPKFKVESTLDGVGLLSNLGVTSLFTDAADLSNISATPLKVSKITHTAVLEVDEEGTEAAAFTDIEEGTKVGIAPKRPPHITIDRPFLFGILRNDDVLFLGQFV